MERLRIRPKLVSALAVRNLRDRLVGCSIVKSPELRVFLKSAGETLLHQNDPRLKIAGSLLLASTEVLEAVCRPRL